MCKTDICFMRLLNGEPATSASTIVSFQRGHSAEAIEGLFYQFVEKLYEKGEEITRFLRFEKAGD